MASSVCPERERSRARAILSAAVCGAAGSASAARVSSMARRVPCVRAGLVVPVFCWQRIRA